jgi:hypothetical protein
MKVSFSHPRSSDSFPADVEAECTGSEAVAGLVEARFLSQPSESEPYGLALQRTGKEILPPTTLGEVGIREGDTVAVTQSGRGA